MADVEDEPTPSDEQRLAMTEPPLDVLLEQAGKLTTTCRSIWVTNILGCLYVWLAIASLKDIQLFIPEEGLVLPILQTEISPAGFFVFAPLLLLANYLHLHIMLGRLWKLWGRLREKGERIDGLPLGERTTPWLLAALLPGEAGEGWLARAVAGFFAYWFGPLTILAAGWRYLRAHELDMQVYHAALVALAVTAALEFRRAARRTQGGGMRPGDLEIGVGFDIGWRWGGLVIGAMMLTHNPWTIGWTDSLGAQVFGSFQRALSPHAQLFRAELTRKPEGWSESAYQAALDERARLRACKEEATDGCPEAEALDAKLAEAKRAVERLHADLTPAALGLELASKTTLAPDYCRDIERIRAPRDLLEADLREAHLTGANLTCARMEGADLRDARMEGADLTRARMEGADLTRARMEGANLVNAQLDGANLWGVDLRRTDLRDATFAGAGLRTVDLTMSLGAAPEQVTKSFGDGSVQLTCAQDAMTECTTFARPDHWPEHALSPSGFIRRWKGWRLSQGLPAIPPGKGLDWLRDNKTYPAILPDDMAFYNPAPGEFCGEGGTAVGLKLFDITYCLPRF